MPCHLGKYTLFERIGYGGMANIYLARHRTELGAARLCVIKEVLPELAHDERLTEMLVEEARISSRLNHANVVKVEDLGRALGSIYIAMEYVEGFDLRELLRRAALGKVPFPVAYSLLVVGDVLRGLDYAHRLKDEYGAPLGIVHRDVSPANVLVSFEGEVKICDFGIARASAVTSTGDAFQGKAGYMSPEHAQGEALDARADVFAVGIMLWELLAGRRLYKAKSGESLLDIARRADIPPLPSRGFPEEEELFAIVRRALAKDRDERYPTARAMLKDLEQYASRAPKMRGSPLHFGAWLREHFGKQILSERRSRQRAIEALERGPVAVITAIAPPKKRAEVANANAAPDSERKALDPAERQRRLVKKRRETLEAVAKQGVLMKVAAREATEGGYAGAILLLAAAMVAGLVMLAFTSGG
jgi:eukaryotic-like serine/threonine-protein kinase